MTSLAAERVWRPSWRACSCSASSPSATSAHRFEGLAVDSLTDTSSIAPLLPPQSSACTSDPASVVASPMSIDWGTDATTTPFAQSAMRAQPGLVLTTVGMAWVPATEGRLERTAGGGASMGLSGAAAVARIDAAKRCSPWSRLRRARPTPKPPTDARASASGEMPAWSAARRTSSPREPGAKTTSTAGPIAASVGGPREAGCLSGRPSDSSA
mmetsp:Transcript_111950/g.280477  ORF Transcript_111950/g.280477 Transcript_111950/m.280477 type:complete len:213 (+) Transcript_111950:783-1421(+)